MQVPKGSFLALSRQSAKKNAECAAVAGESNACATSRWRPLRHGASSTFLRALVSRPCFSETATGIMAHYFIANHEKRFVAIASPKCGSTAVRSWFLQTAGIDPATPRAIERHLVDPHRLPGLGAYERILFVRDPLRRLVGFYWHWVVRDSTQWCFLDRKREQPLHGATFRDLIEAIDRARRAEVVLQHHLLAQVANLPNDRAPDRLASVERLDDELAALNARFGLTGYDKPRASRVVDSTLAEPVMDREPAWFDPGRGPAFELFYDAELASTARRCFAEDVALHTSIPGAFPLRV